MFRRGMASVALGGLMAVAVGVPIVSADTFPVVGTFEGRFAEGFYVKGPLQVDVVATLGKSVTVDHSGDFSFHELDVNLVTTKDITCHGKGHKHGQLTTFTFGSNEKVPLKFAKDLKTLKASGRIEVTEFIDDSCTGNEVEGRTYTIDVSIDLHATGRLTSTTDVTTSTAPEGVYTETLTTDQRPAEGTMTINGKRYPAKDTSISHQIDVVTLAAP